MTEIDGYIYGKKIGTLLEHKGTIFFQYNKDSTGKLNFYLNYE